MTTEGKQLLLHLRAHSPIITPNGSPKTSSQFRELHKRCLVIKMSKAKEKPNDSTKYSHGVGLAIQDYEVDDLIADKQQSLLKCEDSDDRKKSSSKQDNASVQLTSVKHQKLYQALDLKERWKRKSNM